MITFILLIVFLVLAIAFAAVAYSSNDRKHAGQSEAFRPASRRQNQNRTAGQN